MTPLETSRLTHLLAMTASPHDGEALNAARLAWKFMREMGINFQDVVEGKGMPQGHSAREKAYEEGYEAGYAQGFREGQATPRPRPGSWQALVRELLDQPDNLSEWEEGFLESFASRRWHTPTDRQRAVLERIADKLGLELPSDGRGADDGPGPPPAWVNGR